MANLRDLRKRISTVKSTKQITKAMKMVSASKLRRSQESLLQIRPYAYKIIGILNSLKERMDVFEHPLLRKREIKRTRIIVVSSDRGLCGSYNSNIIKKAETYFREAELNEENCVFDFVGKKAYEYFKKRYKNIGDNYRMDINPSYESAAYIADRLITNYIEGDFDSLVVIYNEFKSAMTQKIVVERMFPIVPPEYSDEIAIDQYLYEPNKEKVISELLPKYVSIKALRILLESTASEHGARMTAMDNATRNSEDMMKRLSLKYNRQRQAAITTELMEIVGGKEALENG
ncbi:MAG: ATP synthase F1 subunit gamma [Proteobacteria bacterium]|nr:ATP synthase F1 subunit gamma [Pseudomonadota bacterium]